MVLRPCIQFLARRLSQAAGLHRWRRSFVAPSTTVGGGARLPSRLPASGAFCFGGIMAFFGLDEESRLLKKYEEEVSKGGGDDDRAIEATEKLKDVIKLGILNIQKEELEKAETTLHIALRMAQDIQHHKAVTYVLDLLANLALDTKSFKKAETLFVEVMKRQLADGVGQEDNSIVEMSLKLATVYASTGQLEKARLGFEYCIESQEKKVKSGTRDEDTLALLGMSRDWFAQFLMTSGDLAKARKLFLEAYEIAKEVGGDRGPQTLVLLNSLGTVHAALGDNEAAKKCLEEAIAGARASGDGHLAAFLVNYGMINLKMGLEKAAFDSCQEARKAAGSAEVVTEADLCLKRLRREAASPSP